MAYPYTERRPRVYACTRCGALMLRDELPAACPHCLKDVELEPQLDGVLDRLNMAENVLEGLVHGRQRVQLALDKLGERVTVLEMRAADTTPRLLAVEQVAHTPFDFSGLLAQVAQLETTLFEAVKRINELTRLIEPA